MNMKKYTLGITVLLLAGTFACSEDKAAIPKGFNAPFLLDPGTILETKSYNVAGKTCGPSAVCAAIIHTETIDATNYIGIAIANLHEPQMPASAFKLKIYFPEGSIVLPDEGGSITISPACTVIVQNGANYQRLDNQVIPMTIDHPAGSEGVYRITFNSAVPLTSVSLTIGSGEIINAKRR